MYNHLFKQINPWLLDEDGIGKRQDGWGMRYTYTYTRTLFSCVWQWILEDGEHLENLGISQLSEVWCYEQICHYLPMFALFHYFLSTPDHARQNPSQILFSALHEGGS